MCLPATAAAVRSPSHHEAVKASPTCGGGRSVASSWVATRGVETATGKTLSSRRRQRSNRKRRHEARREPVASNSTTAAKPKRTQAPENLFEYICPCCSELVTSTVRTGKVRHGGKCGGRFRVRDGRTVAKGYVYVCPFCTGKVLSNMKTGQINHRSVCNNQFYVKDGEVSKATRMYAHACPVCHTVVWSSRSCGRIFLKHQTSAGKPCKTTTWRVQENKAQKR